MSQPLDRALEGLFVRIRGDAEAVALIGADATGEVKVAPGWWTDTEDPADYPRVAVQGEERPIGPGRGWVPLQLDLYVWHEGDPDAALKAIDGRICALIDGKWWEHDGARLQGDCSGPGTGARTWPSPPRRPLRRTRMIRILVS